VSAEKERERERQLGEREKQLGKRERHREREREREREESLPCQKLVAREALGAILQLTLSYYRPLLSESTITEAFLIRAKTPIGF
jgi:hypothetical protein